jgi:tetratricopeptide (TPR) repeat protein
MALLEATDDSLHLARAHLLCGDILMSQGRAEEAGAHFDRAERLFGSSPEQEDLVNLYRDQARRAVLLGRGEEAVERAHTALEIAGDEFPHERGNALWSLAEGLALTGDEDGADKTFREATEYLEAHGHRRDFVEAYRSWGKFLRRAGREEAALEVLERAADLASTPVELEAPGAR